MEKKKYIVSFPNLGNYYIPIYNLLSNISDSETTQVMIPKKNTKHTLEVGSNASPDFICVPFKYTIGNFIESLENGANVLIQAGGGCRFGYYAEVQEQILRDMGYDFTFISLLDAKQVNPINVYKKFKELNPKLTVTKFIYYFLLAFKMLSTLDKFETYIRDNITSEKKKGSFEKLHSEFIEELKYVKSIKEFDCLKKSYFNKLSRITFKNQNPNDIIKIGIVGELFTSMEPSSSFFLEKELAKLNVKTSRYTTATYLLFKKGGAEKKLLKEAHEYIDYALGADGTESVAHTLELINKGYDGIVHIKPFGCTPEINAMPILQRISEEKDIPIMYLTFDSQTSETGIKTRIEAFYDMLKMKKEKNLEDDNIIIYKDGIVFDKLIPKRQVLN